MSTAALTLSIATLVVVLAALSVMAVRLAGERSRAAVTSRMRSRVVVTLKSGAAFDGVLYAADRSAWVLRNAHALGAGDRAENVPVDGEVLILASDIEFAQRP